MDKQLYDDTIITLYHYDQRKWQVWCDEEAYNRLDELLSTLSEQDIKDACERYNLAVFGVTASECSKQSKCLLCKDYSTCEIGNRKIDLSKTE